MASVTVKFEIDIDPAVLDQATDYLIFHGELQTAFEGALSDLVGGGGEENSVCGVYAEKVSSHT